MHPEGPAGWLLAAAIVSIAYLLSFAATFGLLMPAQRAVLPEFANHASILFLPHGVRVLTAWLYGWRAIPFLAPASLLTHAYLYGTAGFSGWYFFGAMSGVVCATFSFILLARCGMEFRHGRARLASWREILLAGSIASILNAAGNWYFYGFELRSASAFFIGDIGGLLAAMLILMFAFRLLRQRDGGA